MAETSVTTPERLAVLAEWLGARLGAADFTLVGEPEAASNGSSNETALVAGRWTASDGVRSEGFVVRTAPRGEGLYDRYDLALQYRTMEALAGTDVPVPRLVGLEEDPRVLGEPFYVMVRSPGLAPPDLPPYTAGGWLLEAPPHEQGRLLEATIGVIGRIHRVDVDAHGLGFLNQTGAPTGFDDQFDRAVAWYRWAAGGREQPVMDATLAWLDANRPADAPPEGLNWGDVRLGNVLYEGVEPVCVLDWEMAGLGPAEVDLGWWFFMNRFYTEGMGTDPLPGFPGEAAEVARFEQELGRPLRDQHFYEVFGGFRFGIIVMRAAQTMMAPGAEPPVYERVNPATGMLARMIGAAPG